MSILIRGITIEQFYKDLNTVDDMDIGWDIMQLPPHGRLIDADALYKSYGASGNCNKCDFDAYKCQYYNEHTLMEFCELIDYAPTIIEAEGGKT